MPYVICDVDGTPVTPQEAKAVIAERFTVTAEVRARRRSKKAGKAPMSVHAGRSKPGARGGGERGDLPRDTSSDPGTGDVNHPNTSSKKKAS